MYIKPTDSELEILNYLWQAGPSTVRAVHDALSEAKDVGYTTTLKLMALLSHQLSAERFLHQKVCKRDF